MCDLREVVFLTLFEFSMFSAKFHVAVLAKVLHLLPLSVKEGIAATSKPAA